MRYEIQFPKDHKGGKLTVATRGRDLIIMNIEPDMKVLSWDNLACLEGETIETAFQECETGKLYSTSQIASKDMVSEEGALGAYYVERQRILLKTDDSIEGAPKGNTAIKEDTPGQTRT